MLVLLMDQMGVKHMQRPDEYPWCVY
uniref:Uncharacterized protein n=1 Tax=Arundo donax TaxID=35708 RepID=A0A0A9BCG3_ARUDO